jgi:hypothetical protein
MVGSLAGGGSGRIGNVDAVDAELFVCPEISINLVVKSDESRDVEWKE